jgi:hypothetical protein
MQFDPRNGSTLGKTMPTKRTRHATTILLFNIFPKRIIWSTHFDQWLYRKEKRKSYVNTMPYKKIEMP